jgi:lipopolysaccharide export LptBFGC system permease protein LptF
MKLKPFLIFILFALCTAVYANETVAPAAEETNVQEQIKLEDELLSMKTTSEFDARFDSPTKKFYFYKGGVAITEKNLKQSLMIRHLRKTEKNFARLKLQVFRPLGFWAA